MEDDDDAGRNRRNDDAGRHRRSDGARRNRNVDAGRNRRSDGVRILHTSDWHLGRSFHRVSLLDAQAAYLDHLVATVRERDVDVVLVAGDVYDRAVPPLTA
ncbi:metallophosphoesterase family protein, partial [Streptomyces sp. rh207]|uniref:metallophosphoesterase family protein n=1 Tax=Streptomyces sp. rh207 TaxID=2034269 RepID=UPI00211D893B